MSFLDAFPHLYKRVCPSVHPSVHPSVGQSVRPWAEFEQNSIRYKIVCHLKDDSKTITRAVRVNASVVRTLFDLFSRNEHVGLMVPSHCATVSGESSAPPPQTVGDAPLPPPSAPDGVPSCGICMDTVPEIKRARKAMVSTNCGHMFCETCLKDAMRRQKLCPTCRKKLTAKNYRPLFL